MKSLVESLFDGNLVSKDTGYEYLYNFITYAGVYAYSAMNYFDERKIKLEFNKITKNFPPQDWSISDVDSMRKIQKMPQNEILRQLLYIIAATVKFTDIKRGHTYLANTIRNIISKYVSKDDVFRVYLNESPYNKTPYNKNIETVRIDFQVEFQGRVLKNGIIRFNYDESLLFN